MMVFKPAGKINYAEAPVLLHFFELQYVSICEGMESSKIHHGQDTAYNFSVLSSSYNPFKASFYADHKVGAGG